MHLYHILSDYGTCVQKVISHFTTNTRLSTLTFYSRKDIKTILSFLLHKRFITVSVKNGLTYYNLNIKNIKRRLYFSFYIDYVNRVYGNSCMTHFMQILENGICEIQDKEFVLKMVNAGTLKIVDRRITEGISDYMSDESTKKVKISDKKIVKRDSRILYENTDNPAETQLTEEIKSSKEYVIVDYKRLENKIFALFFSEYLAEMFDPNLKHIYDITHTLSFFTSTTVQNTLNTNFHNLLDSVDDYLLIMKGHNIIQQDTDQKYRYNHSECNELLKDYLIGNLTSTLLSKDSMRILNYLKDKKEAEEQEVVKYCLLENEIVQKNIFKIYEKGFVQCMMYENKKVKWGYDRKKATYALLGYIEEELCVKHKFLDIKNCVWGGGDEILYLNDFIWLCKMHFMLKYEI